MQIRRFSSEDLTQAVELYNPRYPEHPRSLKYATSEKETYPTDRDRERFVSGEEDKLVGLLILSTCNWLDGDRTFEIHIFAHPEHRSRGHGRRLYRLAETCLGYLNWRKLMAGCRESNEAATARLARLGFLRGTRRSTPTCLHPYRHSSFELWRTKMANPAHLRGCDLARPRLLGASSVSPSATLPIT